jgi:hypothetical protein
MLRPEWGRHFQPLQNRFYSVVDRHRVDADLGSDFYFDANPNPDPTLRPGQGNNWQKIHQQQIGPLISTVKYKF